MKKVRIIMALLVLLGVASLAEAQIVVSQTTASTTKVYEKSGREKGFLIRPEVGLGVVFDEGWFLNLQGTFAYQFNPYFTIGAGIGMNIIPSTHYYRPKPLTAIPLYANTRVYFCDRRWSPFFDVRVGFEIPLNESYFKDTNYHDIDNSYREFWYSLKGFVLCGTLGIQYKSFDFGCTVGMLNKYTHITDRTYSYLYDSYSYDYESWNSMKLLLGGYVAYNIPL